LVACIRELLSACGPSEEAISDSQTSNVRADLEFAPLFGHGSAQIQRPFLHFKEAFEYFKFEHLLRMLLVADVSLHFRADFEFALLFRNAVGPDPVLVSSRQRRFSNDTPGDIVGSPDCQLRIFLVALIRESHRFAFRRRRV
jgi:hypothetical protein